MLKWYRSWPTPGELTKFDNSIIPPHVCDTLPKIEISKYNYQNAIWPDDKPGFCMLEWDIALDPVARRAFAAEALISPREILVANYRFHDTVIGWIGDGGGPSINGHPTNETHNRVDNIGLGCIYIPQVILQEFLAQMNHFGFTDYTFGKWHYEKYGSARLTHRVHPQHLHEYDD